MCVRCKKWIMAQFRCEIVTDGVPRVADYVHLCSYIGHLQTASAPPEVHHCPLFRTWIIKWEIIALSPDMQAMCVTIKNACTQSVSNLHQAATLVCKPIHYYEEKALLWGEGTSIEQHHTSLACLFEFVPHSSPWHASILLLRSRAQSFLPLIFTEV